MENNGFLSGTTKILRLFNNKEVFCKNYARINNEFRFSRDIMVVCKTFFIFYGFTQKDARYGIHDSFSTQITRMTRICADFFSRQGATRNAPEE